MASIVKVNNIQDTSGNVIAAKCGTTLTLGGSGDTIALACGASQTGFGASGAVTWVTTPKTATFTAVTTNGYFVNTTSGVVTANLSAGSAGDIVAFSDYANTWNSNALTLSPNGSDPINGVNEDVDLSTGGLSVTLVYVDGTRGWKNIDDATTNVTGTPNYVTGTGGTPCAGATSGDYKIHTFTADGPFNVTAAGTPCGSTKIDYLVVAGGGGGSSGTPCDGGQGAAGAGGFRESVPSPAAWTASPLAASAGALTASVTDYTITVGGGGAATPIPGPGGAERQGCSGGVSTFSTITSAGGGGGGSPGCSGKPAPFMTDLEGGSGGGIGYGGYGSPVGTLFGAGNEPPTSPPQGNNGGGAIYPAPISGPSTSGGGGGGALTVGANAPATGGAAGGTGATTCISGTPTVYSGGGGAGVQSGFPGSGGTGGPGGGGAGAKNPVAGVNGTDNTGGGGGGGGTPGLAGGSGGSGVVIVRYKFQN